MTTLNNGKLSLRSKLSFAGLAGGNTIINYIFIYFIMIYFTDVFGISPAVAGTLLLIARIWDAVNDPIAGIIIDKTKSSKGKARPYLLYLAIPTAIFLVLTFTTPNLTNTGKLIWAYVTYIGLGMCLTITMIATLTLMPRMTKNPIERVGLSAYYYIGSSIFGIVVAGVFMPLVAKLGKGNIAQGYQLTATAFGIIILVFLLGCFNTREIENDENDKEKKNTVSEMLKSILRNPPFIILAIIGLVTGISGGLFSGSLMYYMKRPDLIPVFMPVYMIMMIVAM